MKMDIDSEYSKIKNSLHQAQLRLQNDLIDIRKNRMSTKLFDLQMSDIIQDDINSIFTINVLLTTELSSFHFLIIFNKEYPFSPPFIKMLNSSGSMETNTLTDQSGKVKLKFLNKEFWSPVLSLNSIIFALELMIIEPDESNINMSSLDLYKKEEIFYPGGTSKFQNFNYNSYPIIVNSKNVEINKKQEFENNITNDILQLEVKRFKSLEITTNRNEKIKLNYYKQSQSVNHDDEVIY